MAFAIFGDTLTANQLAYKEPHPHGDESRFQAAARLVDEGGVVSLGAGYYRVRSDEPKAKRLHYDVCAIPGELACDCSDGTHSKHNKTGVCKHQLAAIMVQAIQEA